MVRTVDFRNLAILPDGLHPHVLRTNFELKRTRLCRGETDYGAKLRHALYDRADLGEWWEDDIDLIQGLYSQFGKAVL